MSTQLRAKLPPDPKPVLPTHYDLPSEQEGELGMADEFHVLQAMLLRETFRPPNYWPNRCFSAIDMNLYYDPEPLNPKCKRPDWFGVVGVPYRYKNKDTRNSYAVWDEDKGPLIAVELLSRSTRKSDLGQVPTEKDGSPAKWVVYERILKIPYYVAFDGKKIQPHMFRHDGERYHPIPNHGGRIWLLEAGLGLGLWYGAYEGHERLWLRWYDSEGDWIPTRQERLDRERAEKEKLAAKLRELGIDPTTL